MRAPIDFSKEPAMEVGRDNHSAIRTVRPENIFYFPQGILGFENIKKYIFLLNEKVKPFLFMQALEVNGLSFVCIESFIVRNDYNIKIPDANVKFLDLKDSADVMVLSLVTVKKRVEDITANLMSPLIINMRNSTGMQIIQDNDDYPVRYKIWESLENPSAMFDAG
jgi:flagellar assembly factor FliW